MISTFKKVPSIAKCSLGPQEWLGTSKGQCGSGQATLCSNGPIIEREGVTIVVRAWTELSKGNLS